MKTAALLLKLMFVCLLLVTLGLMASEIQQAWHQTARPVFAQAAPAAPSVYAYTRPDGK